MELISGNMDPTVNGLSGVGYIVTEAAARWGGYEVERATLSPSAATGLQAELVALARSLD